YPRDRLLVGDGGELADGRPAPSPPCPRERRDRREHVQVAPPCELRELLPIVGRVVRVECVGKNFGDRQYPHGLPCCRARAVDVPTLGPARLALARPLRSRWPVTDLRPLRGVIDVASRRSVPIKHAAMALPERLAVGQP